MFAERLKPCPDEAIFMNFRWSKVCVTTASRHFN